MLKNPLSKQVALFATTDLTIPPTFATDALVSSGPVWQPVQPRPLPPVAGVSLRVLLKSTNPAFWEAVSASGLPARKLSKGVWSETRVAS